MNHRWRKPFSWGCCFARSTVHWCASASPLLHIFTLPGGRWNWKVLHIEFLQQLVLFLVSHLARVPEKRVWTGSMKLTRSWKAAYEESPFPGPRLGRKVYSGWTSWGKNLLRSRNLNPVTQGIPIMKKKATGVFVSFSEAALLSPTETRRGFLLKENVVQNQRWPRELCSVSCFHLLFFQLHCCLIPMLVWPPINLYPRVSNPSSILWNKAEFLH